MIRVVTALAFALASAGAAAQPSPGTTPERFRTEAQRLAGDDLAPLYRNFCDLPDQPDASAVEIPATRVFDNLVFLGRGKWNAWALLTSDGIILFDSLETNAESEKFIVGGLRALGLDPATIKYVVVMHGHGDHFGGARLLQQRYGARVLMSEADWRLVALTAEASRGAKPGSRVSAGGQTFPALIADQPVPERDMTIEDGMTLTLGDTSVRLFLTPGHTPGTASALLPLRDGAHRHLGGYWGGTGFGRDPAALDQYLASLGRFAGIAAEASVDVALSNHPTADTTLLKLPALAARKPGEAHPFVIGAGGYQRLLGTLRACGGAARADLANAG